MATVSMTKDNADSLIDSSEILLIDFWASWCGPCRMFGPIFEKASDDNPNLTFAKVDTEAEQELAGAFGIRSIPTLAVFRDGILLYKQAGALPKDALDDLIGKVLELDMDEVRAKVEEEKAAAAVAN